MSATKPIFQEPDRGAASSPQLMLVEAAALREEPTRNRTDTIAETRIQTSLADVEAGRVRFASPRDLSAEIFD